MAKNKVTKSIARWQSRRSLESHLSVVADVITRSDRINENMTTADSNAGRSARPIQTARRGVGGRRLPLRQAPGRAVAPKSAARDTTGSRNVECRDATTARNSRKQTARRGTGRKSSVSGDMIKGMKDDRDAAPRTTRMQTVRRGRGGRDVMRSGNGADARMK